MYVIQYGYIYVYFYWLLIVIIQVELMWMLTVRVFVTVACEERNGVINIIHLQLVGAVMVMFWSHYTF